MATDHETLAALNLEIGDAETRGDKPFFEVLLASSFAFRRANGVVVDRQQFLDAVTPSPARSTSIRSITIAGQARAVVSCMVRMEIQGAAKDFDNLRVFIRTADGRWQLMAWANEPV